MLDGGDSADTNDSLGSEYFSGREGVYPFGIEMDSVNAAGYGVMASIEL